VRALLKLCFSGRFAQKEIDHKVFGDGGLFAYLGTRDLKKWNGGWRAETRWP